MSDINVCQWLYSNRGPLESRATALPTQPQPLPKVADFTINIKKKVLKQVDCITNILWFQITTLEAYVGVGV